MDCKREMEEVSPKVESFRRDPNRQGAAKFGSEIHQPQHPPPTFAKLSRAVPTLPPSRAAYHVLLTLPEMGCSALSRYRLSCPRWSPCWRHVTSRK
jgi:hypothetical protein